MFNFLKKDFNSNITNFLKTELILTQERLIKNLQQLVEVYCPKPERVLFDPFNRRLESIKAAIDIDRSIIRNINILLNQYFNDKKEAELYLKEKINSQISNLDSLKTHLKSLDTNLEVENKDSEKIKIEEACNRLSYELSTFYKVQEYLTKL